jgi:hypothetical protein
MPAYTDAVFLHDHENYVRTPAMADSDLLGLRAMEQAKSPEEGGL